MPPKKQKKEQEKAPGDEVVEPTSFLRSSTCKASVLSMVTVSAVVPGGGYLNERAADRHPHAVFPRADRSREGSAGIAPTHEKMYGSP